MPFHSTRVLRPLLASCLLAGVFVVGSAANEPSRFVPDAAGHDRVMRPFLQTHCLRCHGPEMQEGEFRVDMHLPNDFLDLTAERCGLTIQYAYEIPRELENFWFQSHDDFARPELWVDWMEIEGPVYESWPPRSHRRVLLSDQSAVTLDAADERQQARKILAWFMRRAYRRPVSPVEIDQKLALFDLVRDESPTFIEAIKPPLISVLVSPHFLYLAEPTAAPSTEDESSAGSPPRLLNDHELASRLSYFLWSTMPDDDLFRIAAAGTLHPRESLLGQVERMLADPKSQAPVKNFASHWLGLREVGANPPAADLFPHYDRHLETSIVAESEAFFAEILNHDLDAMNFVAAVHGLSETDGRGRREDAGPHGGAVRLRDELGGGRRAFTEEFAHAGRRLGLKHGQHLAFPSDSHPPLANLMLTLIQRAGAEQAESFVAAYRLIKQRQPAASLNLLWAMAAGLEGKDWREMSDGTKDQLRQEADKDQVS